LRNWEPSPLKTFAVRMPFTAWLPVNVFEPLRMAMPAPALTTSTRLAEPAAVLGEPGEKLAVMVLLPGGRLPASIVMDAALLDTVCVPRTVLPFENVMVPADDCSGLTVIPAVRVMLSPS